jgi:tyramine---L-glutamate ligase
MRVFVYEYVTGGGWFEQVERAGDSLLSQGAAMAAALAADFGQLAEVELTVTRDARLPFADWPCCRVVSVASREEEREWFMRLATEADWTLVVAPETGGVLLSRARLVEAVCGRLLSPPPGCIELAGSKQRTSEVLTENGVRTPLGCILTASSANAIAKFGFPLVAKPLDGCGSEGLRLLRVKCDLAQLPIDGTLRVEQYMRGRAASVAVLCGPAGDFALPPGEQRLSRDGRFTYLGGKWPLAERERSRAERLALAAVRAIGPRLGYLGVDLVLGEEPDGSGDYVIEVNPRLTTSYVGLRAAARSNLAAAMLAVAAGQPPDLSFTERTIEFKAEGRILEPWRAP